MATCAKGESGRISGFHGRLLLTRDKLSALPPFLCVDFKTRDTAAATFCKAQSPGALRPEDSCKVAGVREAGQRAHELPLST